MAIFPRLCDLRLLIFEISPNLNLHSMVRNEVYIFFYREHFFSIWRRGVGGKFINFIRGKESLEDWRWSL